MADDDDLEPQAAPPKSALKDEWVAHAVGSGADPGEAAAMTKADLIAEHGGPDKAEVIPHPYAYIADEDLYLGDPAESGVLPVIAYVAGSAVPVADVDRYGWASLVHPPP